MHPFVEIPSLSTGEQLYRSKNRLIEGDNLKVLQALSIGSIDLICTDPPYGTGKQFRYNDTWTSPTPHMIEEVYVTEREVGYHANWINFIANRLCLMKPLLKPSGIIAISIGKEELFRLGLLMDDLFGENNRLAIINWQKRYSPRMTRAIFLTPPIMSSSMRRVYHRLDTEMFVLKREERFGDEMILSLTLIVSKWVTFRCFPSRALGITHHLSLALNRGLMSRVATTRMQQRC